MLSIARRGIHALRRAVVHGSSTAEQAQQGHSASQKAVAGFSTSSEGAAPSVALAAETVTSSAAGTPSHFRTFTDIDRDDILNESSQQPVVVHCGARWSPRSQQVVKRLAKWAEAGSGVLCASVELERAPRFVHEYRITSLPSVLFLRGGVVERRADGVDVSALDRILTEASAYREAPQHIDPQVPAQTALKLADQLEKHERKLASAMPWYRRVLEDNSPGAKPLAFRARLGLLRCALAADPPQEADVAAVLAEFREHHEEELQAEVVDAVEVVRLIAHAELLVDAWAGESSGSEAEVLGLYAGGDAKGAVKAALRWYQQEAGANVHGLMELYFRPERRIPDRNGEVPRRSVFFHEPLVEELERGSGLMVARAMLRRLFVALGPAHDVDKPPSSADGVLEREEVLKEALVELEFLLDRKPFVPFSPKRVLLRKGGRPLIGRGTGRRSGYSKKYWIAWGPHANVKNTKPMGAPWVDKND